jgi:hypothetical protein
MWYRNKKLLGFSLGCLIGSIIINIIYPHMSFAPGVSNGEAYGMCTTPVGQIAQQVSSTVSRNCNNLGAVFGLFNFMLGFSIVAVLVAAATFIPRDGNSQVSGG